MVLLPLTILLVFIALTIAGVWMLYLVIHWLVTLSRQLGRLLAGLGHHRRAIHRQPADVDSDARGFQRCPARGDRIRGLPRGVEDQHQRFAAVRQRPVAAVQLELQLAAIRRAKARAPAAIVQLDALERRGALPLSFGAPRRCRR